MSQLITLGRVRLVGTDGVESAAAQPKRMALLAYLALTSVKGAARRDALLALFWPELGDDEGRRALRQGLHYLRRTLGEDVFAGEGDGLRVRDGTLGCDAVELERLIDAGQAEQALALYHGDFLEGFHVDDVAPEYEEWVERTRARLRRRASSGAWTASEAAERTGEIPRAIEFARRACELEPDQEGGWRRLMTLHERVGDRAGALRAYDELATRLEREFDARPAAETSALAESIRTSKRVAAPAPSVEPPPVVEVAPPSVARAAPDATAPAHPRTRALVAAAIAVVLLTGAAFYYGTRDARAEPSLVGTGALARKDRLLVADFADLASDSTLAAAVTEVLRIDLTQSPFVTVLTPRQVRTTLTRMERAPDVTVDDSVAREVALRMAVKAFVTGSVAKVAGAYTVSVQLVAAQSGEPMAAYRETAADSTQLIDAVDRASKRLRHRIGESLRSLRDLPPLSTETSASLAALRKYTEAQQLTLAGKRSEAIQRYEEALAIDTAFAGALSALAMAYESVGNLGRSKEAARRAIRHKDRLPFTDRSFMEASNAHARGDYDTAIEVYRRFLDRYPDSYKALNNLAIVYQDRREFATAESLFTVASRVDSTIANFYFGIGGTQLLQGKFADARRTLDLVARRFPDNPVLQNTEIQLASAQHRWEEAERRAEALVAASGSDTLALVDPFEALALMASAQGRLEEADRLWRTHQRLSAASGSMGRHLFGVVRRAGTELRYRNRPARALAILESALARTPLDSQLPADRPYDELARLNAMAGRLDRARQLAAAADANDRALERQQIAERGWTRGVIALAEGRAAEAVERLRTAAEQHQCTICVLPDLARAYEADGKTRAATAVYERYVTTPWFWRYETDALELGPALEKLASLYDAAGERGKAQGARTRLVQLWRRADAELQPVVAQARSGVGAER
ncbi:MAG TPA: BTAD domain-containing putative transcriptional regulator [Gemmatimonadaceae bacterium]|nr:BTAD domain-containing putative transcriptional regulator [Gemmatimonadaceae bacterium]